MNIQTDGPVQTDVWQHRLYLRASDEWEDVLVSVYSNTNAENLTAHTQVPLDKFILTNSGEAVNNDMEMMRQAVRTIGISLLGGNANIQGHFELGIQSISAVNDVGISSRFRILADIGILPSPTIFPHRRNQYDLQHKYL